MDSERVEFITIGKAIEVFGIGRTKLYELIQKGEIEAFKLGRRTLIRTQSAREFINRLPRL